MELDRTSIVIAQRASDELFDLSLIVVRTYWNRILPIAILGALPFVLLNYWLLAPLTDYEELVMASSDYATADGFHVRYLWMMICMVFLESPLAMCGVTYFLGQAVFIEQPTMKQVFGVVRTRWFSLLLMLGFVRGGLFGLAFALWLYCNPAFAPEIQLVVYTVLASIVFFLVRSFRPFAPEILLLERCPLFRGRKSASHDQSYSRRSTWLHSGSGDLFSVQMGIAFTAIVFVIAMSMGALFLVGVLVGTWQWGWWMDTILFPIILWMMALWETVVRFLLYLNTRIRTEGWEVDLRLKAELQRLMEYST
jgi:hypothetical protein